MAKQQQNDDLFDEVNVEDVEKNLITVGKTPEDLNDIEGTDSGKTEGDGGEKSEKDNQGQETSEGKKDTKSTGLMSEDGTITVDTETKPEDKTETKEKEEEKEEEEEKERKEKETTGTTEKESDKEKKETETQDKDEGKKDDKKKSGSASKKHEESSVHLHAASLQEKGVLPNFNLDDIKDLDPGEALEKIDDHIQEQIGEAVKEGVNGYKNSLSEDAKAFLESLDKGIPFEELRDITTVKNRFSSIDKSNIKSDENLQKELYSEFLRMKDFGEEKVAKFIEKAEQDGELEKEAEDSYEEIKSAIDQEEKAAEKRAEDLRKNREENNKKIKNKITKVVGETKEIIPGVAINDKEREGIKKMMTTPVRYEKRDNREIPVSAAMDLRMKDPVNYEMKLNYFIKNGFFDGNKDVNKLLKKSETSAAKKLADRLDSSEKHKSGKATVEKKKTKEQKEEESKFMFPPGL